MDGGTTCYGGINFREGVNFGRYGGSIKVGGMVRE